MMKKLKFNIIPCPHEKTVSYGKGTGGGPAAILKAWDYFESFDEELGYETDALCDTVIEKPVSFNGLEKRVSASLGRGEIPVVLGGEHSITPRAARPFLSRYKDLSVLQFDAHADLRDTYEGSRESHACPMRRVLEMCPAVQCGIRSISGPEYDWAKRTGQLKKIHWAHKLEDSEKISAQLSRNVYITFDVDAFDPSVISATGTPEPGGLFWYEALDILKVVCLNRNVVGFDVCELAPSRADPSSDFTAAKLVYKIMGYMVLRRMKK